MCSIYGEGFEPTCKQRSFDLIKFHLVLIETADVAIDLMIPLTL
jgi:hypothetical protein